MRKFKLKATLAAALCLLHTSMKAAEERYFYLFPEIVPAEVTLSTAEMAGMFVFSLAPIFAPVVGIYTETHSVGATLAFGALGVLRAPLMTSIDSAAYLKLRLSAKVLRNLSQHAGDPKIEKIHLIAQSNFLFKYAQAHEGSANGMIMLETNENLTPAETEELGVKVISLNEEKRPKFRINLFIDGVAQKDTWVLDARDTTRERISKSLQSDWGDDIARAEENAPDKKPPSIELRVELELVDGSTIAVGALAKDSEVKKILGLNRFNKVVNSVISAIVSDFTEEPRLYRGGKLPVSSYSRSFINSIFRFSSWVKNLFSFVPTAEIPSHLATPPIHACSQLFAG